VPHRSLIWPFAALLLTIPSAAAFDDAVYPDWKGQWSRIGSFNWDPAKPRRTGQQAPLTAEYQAISRRAPRTRTAAAKVTTLGIGACRTECPG
jgi:hypothetical protein